MVAGPDPSLLSQPSNAIAKALRRALCGGGGGVREALDKVIAKIPVGRLGEADEIARVVAFLADADSGFITGQISSVNGGQYM